MTLFLRILAAVACDIIGLACIVWPVLPKSWRAWEFVGRIFHAIDDPSMGIQFMFFWLATIPVGCVVMYAGTYYATRSNTVATIWAIAATTVGIYAMFHLAGDS